MRRDGSLRSVLLGAVLALHSLPPLSAEDLRLKLPFAPGVPARVLFGPGDPPHHLTEPDRNAVDFALPEGSLVVAAASGVVAAVEDRFGAPTGRARENNFVAIEHPGGTRTEYHHLAPGGVLVRPGERVESGEVIGYSGASGRAWGPHLHFVHLRGRRSLPAVFEEVGRTLRRGEIVRSENVPPSLEGCAGQLVRGLEAAERLSALGNPPAALALLERLEALECARGRGPGAKRKSLALVYLRARVNALKEKLRPVSRPPSFLGRPPGPRQPDIELRRPVSPPRREERSSP